MALVVSYAASIELLSRYIRERLPARIFIPASLFIAAGAGIGADVSDFTGYILRSCVAFGLVLQFRLWDDLESLAHDRSVHPTRLLCRMPDTGLISRLLPILAAANIAFVYCLTSNWTRTVLVVALVAVFAFGYRCARHVQLGPLGASHVLLLKYPMFVWILSPLPGLETPLSLLLAMVAVFLGFSIHEVLHDDRLRVGPGATQLVIAGSVSLTGVLATLALLHYRLTNGWTAPLLIQSCCAAMAAVLVVRLAYAPRVELLPRSGYWFFVAVYPALLAFPSSVNI